VASRIRGYYYCYCYGVVWHNAFHTLRPLVIYCASQSELLKNLRHKILRRGTDGFTSRLKEVVLRIFIALKNPSSSAGSEPANLGSNGKHDNQQTTEGDLLGGGGINTMYLSCEGLHSKHSVRTLVYVTFTNSVRRHKL
jgi:hypothetical protein